MAQPTADEIAAKKLKDEQDAAAAKTVNYNKEYEEIELKVESFMKVVAGGGETLNYHMCKFGDVRKTVKIEPKRAEQLNRAFEVRKVIYWEVGTEKPKAIKRKSVTDDVTGQLIWEDTNITELK